MATAGSWRSLEPSLRPEILKVLEDELKFEQMTPVQAASIPPLLSRKDVVAEVSRYMECADRRYLQAATGSGKTLAFAIPTIEILLKRERPLKKHQVGAIIVSPVRELAAQSYEMMLPLLKPFPQFTQLLCTSGTSTAEQDKEKFTQNGGHIVIGTPGRLVKLLNNCEMFNVKELEVLVFDEADRLLSMGFQKALNSILEKLPKTRRTALFSATQTKEVAELIRAGMRNPVRVTVKVENEETKSVQRIPVGLENNYTVCENDEKLNQLVEFIKTHKDEKFIVYFLTCGCVDFMFKVMKNIPDLQSIPIISFHGQIRPDKRAANFNKFLSLDAGVLLSTDVTARGLDMPDVDWIIQFDPPQDPDMFIHRIGRTARMGRPGNALVYLLAHEEDFVEFLAGRMVPLKEVPKSENVPNVLSPIKEEMMKDREIMMKSVVGFVSYIRAYRDHQCNYIFDFNKLDIAKLATAFCLLKLPNMPELKNMKIDYQEVVEDLDSIPYKDKKKEQVRQEKMKKKKEELGENWKEIAAKQSRKKLTPQEKKKLKKQKKKKRELKIMYENLAKARAEQEARTDQQKQQKQFNTKQNEGNPNQKRKEKDEEYGALEDTRKFKKQKKGKF